MPNKFGTRRMEDLLDGRGGLGAQKITDDICHLGAQFSRDHLSNRAGDREGQHIWTGLHLHVRQEVKDEVLTGQSASDVALENANSLR